jgi:ribonuclease E
MVLESNRDLVLRRLVECLGRDRTKHQVAEVTSLGLVQMTRKRIGSGLLESFSETCEHCNGRGIRVSLHGEHDHGEASPKYRRPANAVDPADVAARALAAHELSLDLPDDLPDDLPEADESGGDIVFDEPIDELPDEQFDLAPEAADSEAESELEPVADVTEAERSDESDGHVAEESIDA